MHLCETILKCAKTVFGGKENHTESQKRKGRAVFQNRSDFQVEGGTIEERKKKKKGFVGFWRICCLYCGKRRKVKREKKTAV